MVQCMTSFTPTLDPQQISVRFLCLFSCVRYHDHLFTEFLCYDDGCHLRKFANNDCRRSLNATTQRLAGMEIVIDRMHFKGHTDSWCRETCNPSNFEELKKVRNIQETD